MCDLGMALHFGEDDWRKHKDIAYSKKGDRLITGINKYESCRQKFKENTILTVTSIYVLEFDISVTVHHIYK